MDHELTDAELLDLVRAGRSESFGLLFQRHRAVAQRVARRLVPACEVDDVVSEAFAATFGQVCRGGGPATSFRSYVLTAVRHEAARRRRIIGRFPPTADIESCIDGPPADGPPADEWLADACRALPVRWRQVLWQLEVEGRTPRELAATMNMTPNAVSALACRARAGLRAELNLRRNAA